ncbi:MULTISPECIES: SCO family protein [unclassified Colwellia]|jgi:protein SCO1/2|uniref:SCO family protein n=1 Tax=unclassified Colwellia TaxID=196834 RepID=UPI0015F38133|nr:MULTISPECIES: SCO family protein [unclassified Colwellia]MBA6336641.1 SCO family protein [Colwellia sp. BRX8-7]MBA6348541.1 SCO family protein [Colwellia sp. BRX8-9]MBA6352387.1 SCO family protein [Colwellia sp. BRX9-1]MBA6355158.1 SCO family protein [Colwellia sp. BRX8-3]MBA6361204.1 SCO family protein [Colwellia sp. BRX8-6]
MNKLLYVIVALVAGAVGFFVFQKATVLPQPEHALYYQQVREVKPFQLTNHHNQAFTKEQLANKWSWVFLGYTSCPDVCPTTLQELNFVYDDLKAISKDTQILLVSVDPSRDTPEKLAQYIAYFNEEFIALTGDHGVLFPFARNLGMMYAINEPEGDEADNNGYLVDHSASLVLINPQGDIAAIFKPRQALGVLPTIDGEKLVSDFAKIVKLAE